MKVKVEIVIEADESMGYNTPEEILDNLKTAINDYDENALAIEQIEVIRV